MKISKASIWVLIASLFLHWLLPTAARAHSEQTSPALVQIEPRRDFLTVAVRGELGDLLDVIASDPHAASSSKRPPDVAKAHGVIALGDPETDRRKAGIYTQTHLFLEQNGQVLPLSVQSARFFDIENNAELSGRFEIFLRAARPIEAAKTPLTVASNLFGGLNNSRTIVEMGDQTRVIRGQKLVDFPAALTIPTLGGDVRDFALGGALATGENMVKLLLLLTLSLGASLLPRRRLFWALGALFVGQSLAFLLDLGGVWIRPAAWSGLGLALCVALLGAAGFWLAKLSESQQNLGAQSQVLPALAFLGGCASGFSLLTPLRVWGLPENGLLWCAAAFLASLVLVQSALILVSWPVLANWQRKLTQQAQYGGPSWPRAVQISSLCCGAVGSFYGLQLLWG